MAQWQPPERLRRMRFAHALRPRRGDWACLTAGFVPRNRQRLEAKRPRSVRRYSMHYVLSGTADHVDARGRTRKIGPGDFFEFVPPSRYPAYPDGSPDFLECVLILDPVTWQRCCALGMFAFDARTGHAGLSRTLTEEFERLVACMEARDPEAEKHWPLPQALHWVDQLYRAHEERHAVVHGTLVDRACRLLADDLRRGKSLREIADELGLDYDTFRKHFRSEMGVPPGRFRIRKRIDRACVLLYEGRAVGDVATALGYSDPFLFSRQFKRYTGLAPVAFRRRYGPGR